MRFVNLAVTLWIDIGLVSLSFTVFSMLKYCIIFRVIGSIIKIDF